MSNFLWTLLWVILIAFWLLPNDFTYTMDGVEHHIKWDTTKKES